TLAHGVEERLVVGGEAEEAAGHRRDAPGVVDLQQLDEVALQLDQAVGGAERVHRPRRRGEAELLPTGTRGLQVTRHDDQVVYVAGRHASPPGNSGTGIRATMPHSVRMCPSDSPGRSPEVVPGRPRRHTPAAKRARGSDGA